MKKKGLIISTIVMVVVLVASLSTATFAWFSNQAEATIKNINVTTVAAAGLQVGVRSNAASELTATYASGAITYTGGKFGGEIDSWGSLADFSSITSIPQGTDMTTYEGIGAVKKAVTVADGAKAYVAGTITRSGNAGAYTYTAVGMTSVLSGLELFILNSGKKVQSDNISILTADATHPANGSIPDPNPESVAAVITDGILTSTNAADWTYLVNSIGAANTTSNVTVVYAKFAAGQYLIPVDHNDSMIPTALIPGEKNKHYLELPISVRATVNTKAIICTITVTPEKNDMANPDLMPGMAAASRIKLSAYSDAAKNEVYQPFDYFGYKDGVLKSKASGEYAAYPTDNTFYNALTAGNLYNAVDAKYQTYTRSFVIDVIGTNDSLSSYKAYDMNYGIWIEGTDLECNNDTAGSMFKVDVSFGYVASTDTTSVITLDNSSAPSVVTITGGGLAGKYEFLPFSCKDSSML